MRHPAAGAERNRHSSALETKFYRDFTADSRYPQAFTELLGDLDARNGVALKPEFRKTSYVTVPPLPGNFVERPEALAALRDALAVLLEEMAAAPPVQQCLWGVDENQAAETTEQFVSLSLAQRDQPEGSIRLHDLQLDYVRAQWPKEDKEALDLIHGAVRLSSNVIGKDPGQFASQIVGRLLPYQSELAGDHPSDWALMRFLLKRRRSPDLGVPAINRFSVRIVESMRRPWLRPLHFALHPSGIGLLCTLTGHAGQVNGVAVTPDGRIAVSASGDSTLKVWEVGSGRELRTLAGHTSSVRGVALGGDGRIAVSASDDNTLKAWKLASGRELRTFLHHHSLVTGVALSGDGRIAVSGSWDNTLKAWEVGSGRELRTLAGHRSYGVALSGDGRIAVSASNENTLNVWDLGSGPEPRALTGHTGSVHGVAVTADGYRAVSASYDNTVKVWDLEAGEVLAMFTCDGAALCCAFSDALQLIVAGDAGGHLHFLRLEEPNPKK